MPDSIPPGGTTPAGGCVNVTGVLACVPGQVVSSGKNVSVTEQFPRFVLPSFFAVTVTLLIKFELGAAQTFVHDTCGTSQTA